MHPRLAELLTYADRTRGELLAVVGSLTADQLQAPAPDGGWSVAQHLGHLHLVEQSSVRALFRAFRNARGAGLGMETETGSVVGALDATDLVAGTRKLQAPEFVRPTDSPTLDDAMARLSASRAGLRAWAAEADGFALTTVRFPHPALGDLNLYEWVAMIAGHEDRHTRQIRAALAGARA